MLLLRWVGDEGLLRREWLECREGYVGRLSVRDAGKAPSPGDARYRVYIACGGRLTDTGCVDLGVSRMHLVFRVEGGRILFMDRGEGRGCRGSRNGTVVNGFAVPPCRWVGGGGSGAVGVGGIVLDYCVGCVTEPGALLVSAPRTIDPTSVAPPGWRVYSVRWLPRLQETGQRLPMQLVFALSPYPRGSPEDYVNRARFFARVALVLGERHVAEKAAYAAAHAALRLEGVSPGIDGIGDYAREILGEAVRANAPLL